MGAALVYFGKFNFVILRTGQIEILVVKQQIRRVIKDMLYTLNAGYKARAATVLLTVKQCCRFLSVVLIAFEQLFSTRLKPFINRAFTQHG